MGLFSIILSGATIAYYETKKERNALYGLIVAVDSTKMYKILQHN